MVRRTIYFVLWCANRSRALELGQAYGVLPADEANPMKDRLLSTARISWRAHDNADNHDVDCALEAQNDYPFSEQFDDIYFAARGLAETDHVFLQGNRLAQRFAHAERFCIGETGFGSGLNFLAAWKLWEETQKPARARLHFFSVEKYPFALSDLQRAHASWPELENYAARLRALWPSPVRGFHHLALSERVSLTLYLGDVEEGLRLAHDDTKPFIDAWFLDGFSPAKNPDMWSEPVYQSMALLSVPQATFATFTVAGSVRRGLSACGFQVEKAKGFGRKRDMLCGSFQHDPKAAQSSSVLPWLRHRSVEPLKPGARIGIIGAGIAGASLAYYLARAGFSPIIFEQEKPAAGASGNKAGLIMPRLDRDDSPVARFYVNAWLHTIRLLKDLEGKHPGAGLFNQCGAQRLGRDDDEIAHYRGLCEAGLLPAQMIDMVDRGMSFPDGGVVDPRKFVEILVGDMPVIAQKIQAIHCEDQGFNLVGETHSEQVDGVIIANGLDALSFLSARSLPLTGTLGQIDIFAEGQRPQAAQSYGRYIAPLPDQRAHGGFVIGATYHAYDRDQAQDQAQNQGLFAAKTENTIDTLNELRQAGVAFDDTIDPDRCASRVSVRCSAPDFLPVAGPLPDWGFVSGAYDGLRTGRRPAQGEVWPDIEYQPNIFILTALGSRGLVVAPYLGAMMAARLSGQPPVASADIESILHPARFFIRDMKRGN